MSMLNAGPEQVAQALQNNVLFCHIGISRYRGQKSTDKANIQVEGEDVSPDIVTNPRWRLIDKHWQGRFSRLEHRLRGIVADASPRFMLPGIYVIPKTKAAAIFAEVDRVRDEEFRPAVEEFITGWDEHVKDLQDSSTPEQWEQISKALPANHVALRRYFRVVKLVVPVTGSGVDALLVKQAFDDLHNDLADLQMPTETFAHLAEKLKYHRQQLLTAGGHELVGADATGYVKEIAQATQKFITDSAQAIVDGLRGELMAAIDNLSQRIDGRGVIREGTIGIVQRAFEKLRSFSFAAPPAVLERMKEVEEKLAGYSVTDLNSDNRIGDREIIGGLAEALQNLRKEADSQFGFKSVGRQRGSVII